MDEEFTEDERREIERHRQEVLAACGDDPWKRISAEMRSCRWQFVARVHRVMEKEAAGTVPIAQAEKKARELWAIANPAPVKPRQEVPSFAGKVLTPEAQEVVRICWSLAASNPALTDRAIADRMAEVLIEQRKPFPPEYRLTSSQIREGIEKLREQMIIEKMLAASAPALSEQCAAALHAEIVNPREQQRAEWPAEKSRPEIFPLPTLTAEEEEDAKEALARQIRRLLEKFKDGTEERPWSVSQTAPST